MKNEENKSSESDTQFWLHGFYHSLLITVFIYAIVSLFTFLWWTGCLILFIYLWAGITGYLWYKEKQKDN